MSANFIETLQSNCSLSMKFFNIICYLKYCWDWKFFKTIKKKSFFTNRRPTVFNDFVFSVDSRTLILSVKSFWAEFKRHTSPCFLNMIFLHFDKLSGSGDLLLTAREHTPRCWSGESCFSRLATAITYTRCAWFIIIIYYYYYSFGLQGFYH